MKKFNRFTAVILAFVMSLTMAACGKSTAQSSTTQAAGTQTEQAQQTEAQGETEKQTEASGGQTAVKGFHVDGTKLLDANGNEFVMRGINEAHSWYTMQDEMSIDAIAATGANCIRVVCGDGDQYNKDSADTLKSLITACKNNKLIVILEVHDATGKDDLQAIRNATNYWIQVKDALIGNEDCVILNIANEWVGKWDSKLWRDGYVEAIPKLREAGIRNTIMVDAAGWGQCAKSIKETGADIIASDPDNNTMFSIHMYGTAGKDAVTIKTGLSYATNQNFCVCVGEFGYTHTDGDVNEDYIMQYCTENNIGYLGWSWKGNSGGVEYLDIALEWDGSELSPEWGEKLINGQYGIKATSQICTIYE
ncbi:MAG: glycoside hydrolase family 5 protein [Butyrivibrio sp.]